MSKPWGNIGAWAAEAERAEAEEKKEAAAAAAASPFTTGGGDSQSFPSLKVAANTKQKKKGAKMSLQEFNGSAARDSSASAFQSKGLTPEEILLLPSGPKQRYPDEMQYGRLGGGFSSYGLGGLSNYRSEDRGFDHDNRGNNRRSYGSGFDEDRRTTPPPRSSDYDNQLSSRADEVDNWKLAKKSLPLNDDIRPNRYGSLASGGISKADEVDNWATAKKQITPPASAPSRFSSSSFGTGFHDSPRYERETWKKTEVLLKASVKPNPFGEARPREEVLAEKGLDWKNVDLENEVKKSSRPTSSQSNSRPGSAQSGQSESSTVAEEAVVKPRPKVNPFGDAKPREVLLEEKGLDWKKIDSEFERRRADRPETEAERNLKAEIEHLKKELEKEPSSNANSESLQRPGGNKISLEDLITSKENDFELLIREIDDKVRFGQRATERPGSGAGRGAGFPERPPSQSGPLEDTRSFEFSERPRSRGTGSAWARQGDDRRAFRGGRSGGFLGNRDNDRSRESW